MCVLEISGSSSAVLFYLRIRMAIHHSLNLGRYIYFWKLQCPRLSNEKVLGPPGIPKPQPKIRKP